MKKVDFKTLLEENKNIIGKICRAYANDEEEFQDYFQEVSLQIWKAYDSFKGHSKISTWIYRIALNVCLSELRKEKKRVDTHEYQPNYDIADDVDDHQQERVNALYAAIKTLKKTDRAIILLYLEDKSYKEMANILGITTTNIGVKINRLKQELKSKMYAG
ncbi:sigma-70 family RNA polymerase sigma factor [Marivirga atlantica]|jgi:RNA polymerase sigma-70 factor (ECF subfamily)|uniref:Sigma-70 family RNA polymerase sigma factor n=1 Tax=Marivirga atlantica TaxID=1548457 RepID=A0A937A8S4_9BACT|nr:sigma-70 family RNA polymerase sigma factor [Marivirga atlantica]MBL0764441.1 sigma-70 family RNA polymerase sigma factor [Marivirga atlantica]